MKESDEFLILKKYFKNLGSLYQDSSGILVGPGDDAGLFSVNNSELIFSTDVSNEGIHFPKNLQPDLIAYRACAVAASDIPACGASLKWLSITLVSPTKNISWLKKFAKGVQLFTKDYKVPVLGGDLIVGKDCSISVGVCGEVKEKLFISRSGAKIGDSIYLSGTLGLAKLGLKLSVSKRSNLSRKEKLALMKFLKPKVHTALGVNLRKIANSCIDISDGLLGDLNHICVASKVGAEIHVDSIPYEGSLQDALTWGDDYELCFTVPKNQEIKLNEISKITKTKVYKIGQIIEKKGIKIYQGNREIFLKKNSFDHF
jgi:thiamine-monophosphate kinase